MFGQSHITFAVHQRLPVNGSLDIHGEMLCKAVSFVRERFVVQSVEPGALPLGTVFRHFDVVKHESYCVVAAYRCTQCRTLFIVPRMEDLRHGCTEEFEPKEKTVAQV